MIRGITGRRAKQRVRIVLPQTSTTTSVSQVVEDLTPDPFTFIDQTGVATLTTVTSNTITVTGIGADTLVAAVLTGDGEMQMNGGAWTTLPATATKGDRFAVRHTSSSSNATSVNTTLTIGGVSDTFTSTTGAAAGAGGEASGLLLAITKAS